LESRIRTALWLYAFGAIGLFLLVAPWTAVWTQAMAGLLPTPLGRVALRGPIRGVVSGLGALDLLVAIQFALELWERMRSEGLPEDVDPPKKKTAASAAADGSGWHRTPPES
jgi:hypothetical protein